MGRAVEAGDWGWRWAGRSAWAARGLSFALDEGERVLLLGPSGAGKSTLLAALAGVLGGADEGEECGSLLVAGRHPTRMRGAVGLVMQDPDSQVICQRIGDDVAFGCENLGMTRADIWPAVRAALEAVDLRLPLDRSTGALSGGQKQRLAIAGALAMQSAGPDGPRLLCLDEPTANLDPAGVAQVRGAVEAAVADRRTGLVVVEHRVEVWSGLVDRVIALAPDGGILADGTPDEVFAARRRELTDAGAWVPGADPATWASRDLLTRIGVVFQDPEHQFVAASVRAELGVGLRALGRGAARVRDEVDALLERLHLDGVADANPFTLSGGEKRRLSVGTVLATGPTLIVLDEPTFGQDRSTWTDLVRLVQSILDEGRTIVSVTHDEAYLRVLGENLLPLGPAGEES